MHHAAGNGLLHPSQHGGAPGRGGSITPALAQAMQLEAMRAARAPLAATGYGATSCYGRIIMPIASLAARSFGQSKALSEAASMWQERLAEAQSH